MPHFLPHDEQLRRYFERHAACPRCGGDKITTTLMAVHPGPDGEIVDHNSVDCVCGWKGIRHDMVPDPAAP